MATERGLLEEPWNKFMVLDFINIFLLESSLPAALTETKHRIRVTCTHPVPVFLPAPSPTMLTHDAARKEKKITIN
jgi:hypothetical protein